MFTYHITYLLVVVYFSGELESLDLRQLPLCQRGGQQIDAMFVTR